MDVKEKKMEESFKYHIPEDIPANERTAFHGAAAAAAKAGKKSFNFGGKTHPVTMKKDTATKIADQKESTMTFREKLLSLYEGDRKAHYKGATEPEGMHDISKSSKGAMDMINTPKEVAADGKKAADDNAAKSAEKKMKKSKKRSGGDNLDKGDTNIVPGGTQIKDPTAKMENTIDKYGIFGKTMDQLLNAVNEVVVKKKTEEGSIKGSGTDRKAVLKRAFRAGEKQDQARGSKPAIRAPKGMKGRTSRGSMDAFSAKHKDKGIEKAYKAGFHGDYSGNAPDKGKERMKPQSNFPLNKDQMKARKMMRGK